ncbi:hypothetical protein [Sorangium cellulosum]|uniref:hypothetical protein n=1 Tax=Sorangium cellulosum TaxID=56 RepID=UPI00133149CA|nr:hypothetical protein [Sorangium cellulosum]
MPSSARCTSGGGGASRAPGRRWSPRARVSLSRASGSCTKATPRPFIKRLFKLASKARNARFLAAKG